VLRKDRKWQYTWARRVSEGAYIKKNNCTGNTAPCINSGRGGDIGLKSHQGKRRTIQDLEGDKPPPAPDQALESNWFSTGFSRAHLVVVSLCAQCTEWACNFRALTQLQCWNIWQSYGLSENNLWKAELLKIMYSKRGINWASHNKVLAKNLMLFFRGFWCKFPSCLHWARELCIQFHYVLGTTPVANEEW